MRCNNKMDYLHTAPGRHSTDDHPFTQYEKIIKYEGKEILYRVMKHPRAPKGDQLAIIIEGLVLQQNYKLSPEGHKVSKISRIPPSQEREISDYLGKTEKISTIHFNRWTV